MTQPNPDEATLSEDELQLLGKLDERTQRIDTKVDRVIDSTDENRNKITSNRQQIKRNTTVLGGYSAALMALLVWGADKVSRFI